MMLRPLYMIAWVGRSLSLPQITSGRMNGANHQGEVWI